MNVVALVEILIESDKPASARSLIEASVHRPKRGTRWMATFRDGSGRQLWQRTGLTDHRAALALAIEWEEEARRKRAAQDAPQKKPTIRVRRGSGKSEPGLFTQREVAAFLQISERAVREIERRAIDKLRRHPALRRLWREWQTGEVEKATALANRLQLSRTEVAAVYGLAQTPAERELLRKLFVYAGVKPVG